MNRAARISIISIAITAAPAAYYFLFLGYAKPNSGFFPEKIVNSSQAQAFILPISQPNYLPIRDFSVADLQVNAKAFGLYDVRSERLLLAKNEDQKMPIASLTKLMTAAVILENLDLEQIFTVSVEDLNVDGNGAELFKDERLKGSDLLKIMLIKSSNDAALTFARQAREGGIDLVAEMNRKALEIGMANSKFSDPAGLEDNSSFSTVADLIKLVRYVGRHDLIWQTLLTQTAEVKSIDARHSHHLVNTNNLLGQIPEIIGGKTGYTDGAGGTMALQIRLNGGRDSLISAVLGSDDRFGETKKLLNWVQRAYRWQ